MSDEPRKNPSPLTEMMRQLQVDAIPEADLITVWNRLMRAPLRVKSDDKMLISPTAVTMKVRGG